MIYLFHIKSANYVYMYKAKTVLGISIFFYMYVFKILQN